MKTKLILVSLLVAVIGTSAIVYLYSVTREPEEIEWTQYDFSTFAGKERKFMAPPPPPNYGRAESHEMISDEVLNTVMGVLMLVGFVGILCSVILPFLFDDWRRKRFPYTRPYRWGYANGFLMFATPIFALIFQGGNPSSDFTGLIFFATLFVAYPLGVGIILRSPIAFGLATLFSVNPIAWIINGIYIGNRLNEFDVVRGYFGELKRSVPPPLPPEPQPDVRLIVHDGQRQYAPMTIPEIQDAIQNGHLDESHVYWHEGMQEWQSLSGIYN